MSNVVAFPRCKPPFMEVVLVAGPDIYRATYRDARFRGMTIWEDEHRGPTIERARVMAYDFGQLPVIDATRSKQRILKPLYEPFPGRAGGRP